MFACVSTCRRPGTDRRAPNLQAAHNCGLPGFDTSTWAGDPRRLARVHMGRPRDYAREGKGDWAAPCEPIAETGCPGAWYRTDFMASLLRYYRRPAIDRDGCIVGRIENLTLTRCDDPLVHEAVQILEVFEEQALAEFRERRLAQITGG